VASRFSLIPASPEEPVRWTLRTDLQVVPAGSGNSASWVVKDPLRLTYFQAPAEELAFLKLLDGQASLTEILRGLQMKFPGSTFSIQNLAQFLASAINGGLLRSTECGFGTWVNSVGNQRRSQAVTRKFFSLLVHRVRGIDPTRVLILLYPYLSWIYHRGFVLAVAVFTVCVAVVVGVRVQQLELEIPSLLLSLMTVQNLPLMVLSIVIVKILHEFGHALTCHHYGGECHELGFLLVGFVPLLYCDVSDSWSQQNRWKRMSVAAAGIMTELFLAAVFGLLWIFSLPGTLHAFCLNAMIVCSVNTLVVNGNPLLRYDGYYVLCDLLQIPNLSSEARNIFTNWFTRITFGTPPLQSAIENPMATVVIGCYGLCSTLYRLLMIALILFGVHHLLESVGLESLTIVFVVSAFLGQLMGFTQVVRGAWQRSPGRRRFLTGSISLLAIIIVLSLIPVPYSVDAPFVLTPGVATPVFVQVEGYIEPHVYPGQRVTHAQPLATLRNPELELLLAQSMGDLLVNQARVDSLSSQRSPGSTAGNAIPAAEDAVASARARLKTLEQRHDDLVVVSPVDGIVVSPRNSPVVVTGELTTQSWNGTPLDAANRGAWQLERTLLCWVGSQSQFRAVALVAQNDIELIEHDASVSLCFASAPGRTVIGRVTSRSPVPETRVDRELMVNQMVATSPSTAGEPLETVFAVQVNSPDGAALPPLYSTGYATIRCQPASVAGRVWRTLCHTFSFRL
jgi:putative peptide zinc metalloprotease protein